jgi:eukaryotic-like serine/threonine-protein kinase
VTESTQYRILQQHFEALMDLPEAEREPYLEKFAMSDAALVEKLRRYIELDAGMEEWTPPTSLLLSALDNDDLDGSRRVLVGDFRVVQRVGSGGMGEVFLGIRRRGEVEQRAAIKLIHRGLVGEDSERRFAIEQRALSRLEHPGIARWLDAGRLIDGTPWYAMEYVEGESLTSYCDTHKLDIADRVQLFLDICRTVQFAHARLVLHRDLKPGNILVTADGHSKLLDFGIAKLLVDDDSEAPQRTATAGGFVSAHYSAPEMYAAGGLSVQTDVYSLCAMLYELLCGAAPLARGQSSAAEYEMRVRHEMPPAPGARLLAEPQRAETVAKLRGCESPRQLAHRLRGDLDRIALQGIRKQPAERYGSVAQLIDDLERWQRGEPVLARGAGGAYRMGKFLRRHWALTSLAAALLLTAAAALIVLSLQARQLEREKQAAELERDRAQHAVTLLRDAFMAADPARSSSGDVRVRDVLEAAHLRIDALAGPQPELFVQLATTIGEVEIALGMEEQAALLLQRAGEAAQSSAMTPVLARQLFARSAWGYAGIGKYDEANALLQAIGAPGPGYSALWHAAKARIARGRNELEDAEALLHTAIETAATEQVDEGISLHMRLLLAEVARSLGNNEQSLAQIDTTLAWQRRHSTRGEANQLRTRLQRVNTLHQMQRDDEALSEAAAILEEARRLYGARNLLSAAAGSAMGSILDTQGRYPEAAKHFEMARQIYHETLGDQHANTSRLTFNVALALSGIPDRHAEAERMFAAAIRLTDERAKATGTGGSGYYRAHFAKFLLTKDRAVEAFQLIGDDDMEKRVANARGSGLPFYMSQLALALERGGCQPASSALCVRARKIVDAAAAVQSEK